MVEEAIGHQVQHRNVAAADNGKRLDNLLARYARHLPKSLIYKLIRSGQVRVDKKRARPSTRVMEGQIVRLPPQFLSLAPNISPPAAQVQRMGEAITYSDDAFVLVNKPVGIPAHSGSKHQWGVVELMRAGKASDGETEQRFPELVHRIDRLVSGLLLLAHNQHSLQQLQLLWREHQVEKTYLAVIHKHLKKACTLTMPLLVVKQDGSKRVVVDNHKGKPAITKIRPVQYAQIAGVPVTLVACKPKTGRMHQIRVHCQSIGYPIVGDPLYQNKIQHQWSHKTLGEQLMLHAYRLAFVYGDQSFSFTAEGVERLTGVLEQVDY